MSIREFIEQPILVGQHTVSMISPVHVVSMGLPLYVLNQSAFLKDKLKGYLGFTGEVVVRIVVNADKHTSGRLIAYHIPPSAAGMHTAHFHGHFHDHQLMTQLPNAQLDLNTETEVLLRIPWRSPYSHFNLITGMGNWGTVRISKLLPLRGSDVSVSVFASFEKVELIGPTGVGGYIAQGNIFANCFTPEKKESIKAWARLARDLAKYAVGEQCFSAQGRLEVEEADRPLSSRLGMVSSVATTLSSVPLLSSIATPLAWASALASNVASSLGYSKPINTHPPKMVINTPFAGFNHFDGVDWAEPLACSGQAGVEIDENLGNTKQDEMSFKFLTQVKSSIHRFEWGIDAVAGTKLFSMPLGPNSLSARSGFFGQGEVFVAHPINYLSHMFEYYRGSLEITVVLSKTIFHTGRLMLVYEPGSLDPNGVGDPLVISLADVNPCHKDVVDIRDSITMSVKVPFLALTPYLHRQQSYGHFHIFVVNPLVRNVEMVSSSVDAMIFVNGCDDWEFNGPIEPRVWPFQGVGTALGSKRADDCYTLADDPPFVQQGALDVGTEEKNSISKCIGQSHEPSECLRAAPLCMGERVTSVKQIAMRSKLVSRYGNNHVSDPFSVDPIFSKAAVPSVGGGNRPYRDWYSYVGAMYNYSRGGVILSVYNWSDHIQKVVLVNDFHSNAVDEIYNGVHDMWLTRWVPGGTTARIYIPPYLNGLCRYVYSGQSKLQDHPDSREAGVSNVKVAFMNNADTVADESNVGFKSDMYVYRSAAEDTQFGFFRGVPLLTTPNTKPDVVDFRNAWFPASSLN